MLKVEDLTLENLNDVFVICSNASRPEDEFVAKGREIRTKWLTNMLEKHGSCVKIAYNDEKPIAQLVYYPEEVMKYIHNGRKDVIHIQCVYNAFQEAQGLGAGGTLIRSLIKDSEEGLASLNGRQASYIVGYPFPSAEGILLTDFYSKMGFKQGLDEFYYEVSGKYSPRGMIDYSPLKEDKGRVVIFYNPTCEFGYFYANHVKQILQETFENIPVFIYDVWRDHEEYLNRPQQAVVAARVIVNQQTVNDFRFWTDAEGWLEEVRDKLEN